VTNQLQDFERREIVIPGAGNTPVGRILVVDDEPELRNVLVESIQRHGYEATGCGSGRDALTELLKRDFDLLLTDLMMPEMDGIALLKAALKIDPHLVGIMVTGQGTIQTAVDAMQVGAFDYVLKPFRMQTLLPVLTRAMNVRHLKLENVQLRETVAIHSLCQTIAFTLDEQTVLSRLADAALEQSDADEVSILLPTNDGKELYVAAVRGEKRERLLGERVPLQASISSWVARERMPLILNGEVHDERFVALWPRPEIRSAVSVPMQVANKLVGIINLNVTNRLRPFTLGQMKALSILASTAAAALEGAFLYGKVEQAEKNYRSIFVNAVEGIFQTSPEGRFITANPSMARILGYESPEELIETVSDVATQLYVDPSTRVEAGRIQEEEGVVEGFEFQAYRKDGEKIWLSLNRRSIRNESDVELYFEGSIENVTERKTAETERARLTAEIESQRQRLDNIVATVPGVVWEAWDQPDTEAYRTNFVSDYVETMLGYTPEEWRSTPNFWLTIVHPEDKKQVSSSAAASFATCKGATMEFRWLRKDGTSVWVESNFVVITDQSGKPVGLRGVNTDIDERKKAEEALRQSESLLAKAQRMAHIGSWNWNLLNNDMTWSDEHYRIYGIERGDIDVNNADEVFAFIHPEDREMIREAVAKTTETNEPFDFHYRLVRPDGQERIIQSTGTIETDDRKQAIRMFGTAQDVTERSRIEQELKRSEERYRDVVENAHDLIYEHDLQGNFTSINKAGERITGYSLEESLKLKLQQSVAPEYLERAQEMLRRKLDGEQVTAYDLEIVAKDGHRVAVEVNTRLVLKDGVPVGVQGIARDITERKRAEEALRDSEARKRAILESSMDCIITMDHDGLVVDWNPAAEKTFGYSQNETIGRSMAELIIPERYRERHNQGLARYLATGEGRMLGKRLELSAERRDGTEFPIELTITRIESRGAAMFTGYLRDITDRKKAENRLQAQYAVTRALAESNTISEGAPKILQAVCESLGWQYGSLWTVDRGSNELHCSEVWKSLGAEAHEFETVSRGSVFAPGIGLPGRVWNDNEPLWIPDVLEDKNFPRSSHAGKAGLHGACAFPIPFRSEILGVVEFFSRSIREPDPDLLAMMVTIGSQIGQFIQRKRVEEALGDSEEQLRQSQKLEAIGQLAGGVAHDFNNLLTVIGGYSSILLGKLPEESPHRSSIEEIKKASDRASALTRQLLAFSRKQILQPKVLDLNTVVTDLEKMLRRLIGEDIDLLTITSAGLGKVKADPGQIEQVLLNLIVNARDAMPGGGKLTIETRNVVHSEEYAQRHAAVAGRYVMLAVSDTGCGMDAAIQPRVFEPFFTTKGSGKGTGLGLATVYGIVKQSGGNIFVYSEVGRGSTFKVYLPRVDDVAEADEVAVSKLVPKGTELVLLVEDEEQVRAILKHILENQGYVVLAASNGEQALVISQNLELDIKLLITDVVMPQMSGRELAERVLELRPHLPVLFMSGYTDDAIVRHGLLDEKLNFIQKPFDSASVARKVREVLDSHV
jgi:PAS domain S-box-containing protein